MARVDKKHSRKAIASKKQEKYLSFTRKNYQIFGLGIAVLIIGYMFMSRGPVDSFWSLTLAPILLLIGYLIIIPYSFFYHEKSRKDNSPPQQ